MVELLGNWIIILALIAGVIFSVIVLVLLLIALIKIIYTLIDTIRNPEEAINWFNGDNNDGAF